MHHLLEHINQDIKINPGSAPFLEGTDLETELNFYNVNNLNNDAINRLTIDQKRVRGKQ